MSSLRPRYIFTTVLVCLFALLAESAFATHFRYGYVFWERDLTYSNPTNPNEVKVTVTFETGGRWTYTAWNQATSQGITPAVCGTPTNPSACCAGVISNFASSTFTSLSCPPVNDLVNFAGGVTSGIALVGTGSVTVVARHGVTLTTPIVFNNLTATNIYAIPPGAAANLAMDVIVTTVVPTQDTFYGRSSFTLLMDKRFPLRLIWANSNRLSELQDGNNDIPWRLESIIDLTGANAFVTKSPKSASSAVVTVFTGQDNTVDIPTLAFDNQVNTFRLATSQESGLTNPQPVAPSVFSLDANTGRMVFRPRTNGLYAVQVIVSSKNPSTGAVTESVPLDFMFNAVAGSTYAETLTTGDGQTTYTATAQQPISYTVRSTTTPANAAFNVTINHGVLPPGATFTQPNCAGNAVCVGTFNWTPTVDSTPAVVCYTSSLTSGQVLVATSAQTCVTVNISPLQTKLEAFPASGAAGGGPLVLTAKLTRVLSPAPLPGRTINFSFPGAPNSPPWIGTASAITDAQGIATATVTSTVPVSGPYEATFTAIVGELLAASSDTNVVSVKAATTVMNTPVVQTSPLPTIGYPLSATALLNRVFTDGGTLAVGADVQFTLSGPGVSEIEAGVTGATGVAGVTFASLLPSAGPYTVQAQFSGNASLFPNADGSPTTATTAVTLKRRTQISMQAPAATVGVPAQIVVSLHELPGLTVPLAGRTVQISGGFTGSPMTGVTNGAGVAPFNVTFPAQGTVAVAATYTPVSGETNHNGASATETTTQPVVVGQAATQLSLVSPPATATTNQPLVATAALTRTTAPTGAVSGETVSFTLTRVGGSSQVLTAVTDASGNASVTFSGISVVGTYVLSASFAGTPSLNAATSSTATIAVQAAQATTISVSPASGVAGAATTLTAHLQTTTGTPLSGQPVHFAIGVNSIDATTDANGDASGAYVPTTPGSFSYSASFAGATGYLASTGNSTLIVASAATALAPINVNSTAVVGDSLVASTTLSRTSAPAGVIVGATVTFTVTAPGGSISTISAVTAGNGQASVTLALNTRGTYSISAAFTGTQALTPSSSATSTVTVSQALQVIVSPASGVAGAPIQVTATVIALPASTPVTDPLTVTFTAGSQSAQATVSNGIATASLTFSAAGPLTLTASVAAGNGYLAATSSPVSLTVNPAAAALSALNLSSTTFVGDTAFITTTLTRTSAPAGVIGGATVTFSVNGDANNPGGPTQQTLSATTDAAGTAQVSVPLSARGAYQVTASYAGSGSSSNASQSASFTVFQKTAVMVNAAHGVATDPTSLSAGLVTVPGNTAISGAALSFDFLGVVAGGTALTAGDGVAGLSRNFATPGVYTVTASFQDVANFFADENGHLLPTTGTSTVTIESVATTLSDMTVPATSFVGDDLTVTTVLSRVTAPAGTLAGRQITFSINQSGGNQTANATTDANGVASATLHLTGRGSYTVSASFIGDSAVLPASTSVSGTERQKAQVNVSQPVPGTAGVATQIVATLVGVPGGALSGQTITFSSPSAVPQTVPVSTDGRGIAVATLTFSSSGSFPVTATFAAQQGDFANRNGLVAPETDTTSAVVNAATAQLSAISAPANTVVGQAVTLATTLTRVTAPAGTVGDATVTFTVTQPGGATQLITSTTAGDGHATASFVPAQRGVFSVTASFDGDASLASATTGSVNVTAYQRTSLTVAPATAPAHAPATIRATLTQLPGGVSLSGQTIAFSFSDGSWGTATTDAAGVASVTQTFAAVGDYTATATFSNGAGFYADSTGAFPVVATMATGSVHVTNNAPTFAAPANITNEATAPNGAMATFTATGNDVEDGSIAAVCAPASGSIFPIGSTTVSCTVTDSLQAQAAGTFSVTVQDTTAPALILPTVAPASATSAAGRQVFYTATAADIADPSPTVVCAPASGSTFPIATTTVSCTATDAHNNSSTGSFSVAVTNNAPTFSAPANISLTATSPAGRAVTFSALGSDIEDGSLTADCQVQSGHTFPLGTTNIACTVTDVAGATASGSFSITITNTAPTIVDLPNITASATSASGRVVNFTSTGNDAEDGGLTPVCNATSGATFPLGTTNVTCTVTDVAGATASDSFTITITNNAPTFTAPANISLPATMPSGRVVTFSALGSDIEDGSLTANCQAQSGNTFPLGTTNIACTVTDVAGATASGSFTITITNTAPTIVDLPNLSGEATSAAGRAFTFTSNGNDAEDGTLTPVCSAASGTFPIGTTTVSCTVTDVAGATASDSFTITVADTTAPTVTVTGVTVQQTSLAGAVGIYTFSATDIVDGALTPTCTPASGTTFARGVTTVTCTKMDAHGNTGTATATVTVIDTIKPVVTYTGNAGTYSADQTVNITCAATDSGSGVASTTCANITGPAYSFAVGANNFSANATDVAGNTNSASISFTVTVPPAALGNVINTLVTSPSVAATLNQTLNLATGAPNATARASHLDKMIKDIQKEIGKSITAAQAATLINLINQLY